MELSLTKVADLELVRPLIQMACEGHAPLATPPATDSANEQSEPGRAVD